MATINKRLVFIGLSLLASLVLVLAVVYARERDRAYPGWPPITMFYEVAEEGSVTHYRLDYESQDNWKKTVINVTLGGAGSSPGIGSYLQTKEGQFIKYDADSGEISHRQQSAIEYPERDFRPGAIIMMDGAFGPASYEPSSPAKVCFDRRCVDRAPGWGFGTPAGRFVFADDQRGIPVVVPGLTITEVRVHGNQIEYRGYSKEPQTRP